MRMRSKRFLTICLLALAAMIYSSWQLDFPERRAEARSGYCCTYGVNCQSGSCCEPCTGEAPCAAADRNYCRDSCRCR